MSTLKPKTIPPNELPSLLMDALRLTQRGLWPAMAILVIHYGLLHLVLNAGIFIASASILLLLFFLQCTLVPALLVPVFLRAEGSLAPPTTRGFLQAYVRGLRGHLAGIVFRVATPLVIGTFQLWLFITAPLSFLAPHESREIFMFYRSFPVAAIMLCVMGMSGVISALLMQYRVSDSRAAYMADLDADLSNGAVRLLLMVLGFIASLTLGALSIVPNLLPLYLAGGLLQGLFSALVVVVYLRVFEDRGLRKKQTQPLWWWRRAPAQ